MPCAVFCAAAWTSGKYPGLFLKPIGWEQDRNRFADHLIRRVAEDAFSRQIPAPDDAIEVFADDRIVSRGDDRGEQPLDFLRGERTFGIMTLST